MKPTRLRLPRVDVVTACIVVGCVAVDVEADLVVLGADHGLAGQAKQPVVEGECLAIAELFLVVLDLQVAAAQQLLAPGIPAVVLGVAPVTAALDVVQLVAGAQVVVQSPVGVQAGPFIDVMLHVVLHVVVLLAQAAAVVAVDQRGAVVVGRLRIAAVVGEGEAEVVAGVEAQRGAQRQAAGRGAVDPTVTGLLVQGQAVAQALAEAAAAVQAELLAVPRTVAQAQVVAYLAGKRLFRDHVDHRTGGAFAIKHRGRAANHIDSLDHPWVDRERLGAGTGVKAGPVEQCHHRVVPGKAAGGQARAAVARGADVADAR